MANSLSAIGNGFEGPKGNRDPANGRMVPRAASCTVAPIGCVIAKQLQRDEGCPRPVLGSLDVAGTQRKVRCAHAASGESELDQAEPGTGRSRAALRGHGNPQSGTWGAGGISWFL